MPASKSHVLFVRCTPDLLKALDAKVAAEQKKAQGRSVSRSDVAREILYAHLRPATR